MNDVEQARFDQQYAKLVNALKLHRRPRYFTHLPKPRSSTCPTSSPATRSLASSVAPSKRASQPSAFVVMSELALQVLREVWRTHRHPALESRARLLRGAAYPQPAAQLSDARRRQWRKPATRSLAMCDREAVSRRRCTCCGPTAAVAACVAKGQSVGPVCRPLASCEATPSVR